MLYLNSPLIYREINILPEDINMTESDEYLFCYELDPVQNLNIEPDPALFLKSLIFSGVKTDALCGNEVSLPAGNYLFTQKRVGSCMKKNVWLFIAIDQHKDGLWERYVLENRLYVRYLFEEGMFVTQLFRPVKL